MADVESNVVPPAASEERENDIYPTLPVGKKVEVISAKANGTLNGDVIANGTANGDVNINGTANGDVKINGIANGDVQINSTANGNVQINGAANGEVEVLGVSTDEVKLSCASTGEDRVNGATTGEVKVNHAVNEKVKATNAEIHASPVGSVLKRTSMDDVMPATALFTTRRDAPVKLRTDDTGPGAMKPLTVSTVLKNTVSKAQNVTALGVKRNGTWVKWTYQEYYDDVRRVAKGFLKLGLEPCHGVGIIGFNSPEWFLSDLGAIFAGGFATGIYTTNTPEACQFVAADCEANIIVVENNQQLQKILKVWDSLPHLKAVVQYTGDVAERRENIYSWEEFMKLCEQVPDSDLEDRLQQQAPNKACTLIYTSGTTGSPKGVMLSHDNLTWTAKYFGRHMGAGSEEEVIISYLPLSHVAAQMIDIHISITFCASVYFADPDALKLTWVTHRIGEHLKLEFGAEDIGVSYLPLSHVAAQVNDIYVPLVLGMSVFFAQPDALKGSLNTTLKEVRPTAFLGVPRVWEKFAEKMQEKSREVKGIKKKIGVWAKGKGKEGMFAKMENRSLPWFWGVANSMLFRPVQKDMGLDRCRICVSGAAPIMKETLEFFYSFDISVLEVYGMSESTGPHTIGTNECFRLGSVGKEIPGVHTKLVDRDEDGNGEVCMQGRHVFMGYLNNAEKNAEAFDEDGWLRTGDIGKRDQDNFLFITGRKKELIITAGGENIAPVPVEDSVKQELPVISNCMLIGDKRKFLSMLITLKVTVDLDTGEPQDSLTSEAKAWCQSVGSESTKLSDIIDGKDSVVLNAIQAGIDRANSKAVSRASRIAKWSLLPQDFSIPGGELGPTLKLRRPIVIKKYQKTMDSFYVES